MTDKLTDEERVTLRALTEEVSGIVWAADFVNDLATALSTERTAREATDACARMAATSLLAEREARIASEERVKSLTAELEVTRDALLLAVRRDNDCIDAECGRGDWNSPACFCAREARDMVSTLTAPDKGETM